MKLVDKFNCKDFAELRAKFKSGDKEVVDFIRSFDNKMPDSENLRVIESPRDVLEFAKNVGILDRENTAYRETIIFVDCKGHPIGDCEVEKLKKGNLKEVLNASVGKPIKSFFTISTMPEEVKALSEEESRAYYTDQDEDFKSAHNALTNIDMRKLDSFYQYGNGFSNSSNDWLPAPSFISNESELVAYDNVKAYYESILEYEDLVDFLEYNALEDVKGCNVKHDSGKIAEALKRGFQHSYRETSVNLIYNNDFVVTDVMKTPGEISHALIGIAALQTTLLRDDVKGVWFNHNHPSGNIDSSREDDLITTKLENLAVALGKGFAASSIVGKGGINYIRRDISLIRESDRSTLKDREEASSGKYRGTPPKVLPPKEEKIEKKEEKKESGLPSIHSVVSSMTDTEKVL